MTLLGPNSIQMGLNLASSNCWTITQQAQPLTLSPISTLQAKKRKSEPTQSEITKKIKLSPTNKNTHLRPTTAKKKQKLKALARSRPTTTLTEPHPSTMHIDILINPNSLTEEEGHDSHSSTMLIDTPTNPNSLTKEAGLSMPPTPQC